MATRTTVISHREVAAEVTVQQYGNMLTDVGGSANRSSAPGVAGELSQKAGPAASVRIDRWQRYCSAERAL
jgi:hypothetical protein